VSHDASQEAARGFRDQCTIAGDEESVSRSGPQNWFGLEAFDLLTLYEYEPGHFRTVAFPDPIFITDTLGAACAALQHGTIRWLLLGGHDPNLMRQAIREVFSRMPKKDGFGQ
jgi:hypothetical protein